jgi:hypothetical protein
MSRAPHTSLSPEQEAEAQRLAELMHHASRDEFLQLARLLVASADDQLFGATEFAARDIVHQAGAKAVAVAVSQRDKKTTTRDPV